MKKRSMLLSTALLCSLFIFSGCEQGQQKNAPAEKKDIYLQLYSVRDDIKANYAAIIDSVAKIGYTGVEAAGYADGQFYGMSPADFKKSIEDAGMQVLSSHTVARWQNPLPTPTGKKPGHGGIPLFRHTKMPV